METYNKNGLVLAETAETVTIATGLDSSSANAKTGGMIQVWILRRDMSPLDASKSGKDDAICGDCPHRGVMVDGKLTARRCYVNLGQGPRSIYVAYTRGRYRHVDASEYAELFGGRLVRFGAYGDPAMMPREVVEGIARVAHGWTGYTHQWRSESAQWLNAYCMASCDSVEDVERARADGWRTFRVARKGDSAKLAREISCPASAEAGKRTTCDKCRLCDGARAGDARASIVIQDHSVIASNRPLGVSSAQLINIAF